jgi:hypothetical protein
LVIPVIGKWLMAISVITFVIGVMWIALRAWTQRSAAHSESVHTSEVFGAFVVLGSHFRVSDSDSAIDAMEIRGGPAEWVVVIRYLENNDDKGLEAVTLTASIDHSPDLGISTECYEIVVDSGEIWVVDSNTPSTGCALSRDYAHGSVAFARDSNGEARGLVIRPPLGDGAYDCRIVSRSGKVQIELNFADDSDE